MKPMVIALLVLLPLCGWSSKPSPERNVEAAKKVWESVIAAKGGRDRLHAVRTLGVRLDGGRDWYQLYAFEFPSKVWKRTGPDEPVVKVLDGERGTGAFVGRHFKKLHSPRKGQVEVSIAAINPENVKLSVEAEVCYAVVHFLLETAWRRPEIVALDETVRLGKPVLVVYVNDCFGGAAYVIDPVTKLPSEYINFDVRRIGDKLPPLPQASRSSVGRLDNYVAIDGIMLPGRTYGREGKMTYEVNRDYPESLFHTAPTLSDWGLWAPPTK
ncbi:MAG TPA: hypothetical protein VN622_17725 [Clostridia bacterium]|nr:hypothetical protein [Clostridia bacterium]